MVVEALVERVKSFLLRVTNAPIFVALMGDLILHRAISAAYEVFATRHDSFDDVWSEEVEAFTRPVDEVTHYFRTYSFPFDQPHTFAYATYDFGGFQSWHVFSSRRVTR